jgi:hypothetical protein
MPQGQKKKLAIIAQNWFIDVAALADETTSSTHLSSALLGEHSVVPLIVSGK